MSQDIASNVACEAWPRWWRWTLLALSTLILCSCSPARQKMTPAAPAQAAAQAPFAAPVAASTATIMSRPAPIPIGISSGTVPTNDVVQASAMEPVCDVPPAGSCACCAPSGGMNKPWSPPGIGCPWPHDEYLCDGGDATIPVSVDANWQIYGLGIEDTVAHFDTLDGRRLVEPSNCVCLYAPRFAAVRSVGGLNQNDQVAGPDGVVQPLAPLRRDEVQIAATDKQNLAPIHQRTLNRAGAYQMNESDGIMATTLKAVAFQDAYLPFEDLQLVRRGIVDQAEEARLAELYQAAITWTGDQEVQVILDEQRATEDVAIQAAHTVYAIEENPEGKLRLCKLASCPAAQPGDTVDFTLRYDNVGRSTIGNVTIVDNLTGRLAYVPGSSESSRDANFLTENNEQDSLVLRWEIIAPLEPGEGGVIRFRCRVR